MIDLFEYGIEKGEKEAVLKTYLENPAFVQKLVLGEITEAKQPEKNRDDDLLKRPPKRVIPAF